jgi:hypothetical protein
MKRMIFNIITTYPSQEVRIISRNFHIEIIYLIAAYHFESEYQFLIG